MAAIAPVAQIEIDLSDFNPAQEEAVTHLDGPCRVIAAAGSGKTKVLVTRAALLVKHGVPAASIMAVTFTRKAADEMRERLIPLIGKQRAEEMAVGTFHRICYLMLKEMGTTAKVARPEWQVSTVRRLITQVDSKWGLTPDDGVAFIGKQKKHLLSPQDPLIVPEGEDYNKFQQLYIRYEEAKHTENLLDFDDMIFRCWQALSSDDVARMVYAAKFRYIMVDEFQDTDISQAAILQLLAGQHRNLFVVGDPRQSIYAFREGRKDLILNFDKEWPGTKTVILDVNYRSTENIVQLSDFLMSFSEDAEKYPGACKAHRPSYSEPIVMRADDEDHEAYLVAQEIALLVAEKKLDYKDCAVLYRVNAQGRSIEDAFLSAKLPFTIVGDYSFYTRREVRDMLSYLRVLHDHRDEEALKRALNTPNRYLSSDFFERIRDYSCTQEKSLIESLELAPIARDYRYRGAQEFRNVLADLYEAAEYMNPGQLIMTIRKLTNYDDWLITQAGGASDTVTSRLEILDALAAGAYKFADIASYLEFTAKAVNYKPDAKKKDSISAMTLHAAKGKEFKCVFLVGLVQGVLPHKRAIMPVDGIIPSGGLEEERNLCYVGMTRARDMLYLLTSDNYLGRPVDPSQFLCELLARLGRTIANGRAS